ncbi:MAG: alpha/beta fold hydrolase [Burkholderiales bacterium]
MAIVRISSLFLVVLLALAGGCTRLPSIGITTLKPKSFAELEQYLLNQRQPEVDLFREQGPFAVTTHENHELRLSATQRIDTDLYLAAHGEKAPLAIFMHGYDASKRAHAQQAMHLASWGVHAMAVQLPKTGPWVGHGRTLARIVRLIQASPQAVDSRIDPSKIILIGHSFGASSVAIALAEGAPAAGAILLDPAGVGRDLPRFLQRINRPVMLLGADVEVSSARNRHYFYDYIRSGVVEVSIREASHEDAQFPSQYALDNFGFDPNTKEEAQIAFASALTSATLSLAVSSSFDYAWASFAPVLKNGKFFNPKKK